MRHHFDSPPFSGAELLGNVDSAHPTRAQRLEDPEVAPEDDVTS